MIDIVVLLTIKDRKSFDEYENIALGRLHLYGGRLLGAFAPESDQREVKIDEIHYLRFPDKSAFVEFRNDQSLAALADLRERAISCTRLYIAHEQIKYPTAINDT